MHLGQGGSSLPMGLNSGWPRVAQGPKFKILLPRNFVLKPIEYTCQVLSTLTERSRSLGVLKMLTLQRLTDGRTDI